MTNLERKIEEILKDVNNQENMIKKDIEKLNIQNTIF